MPELSRFYGIRITMYANDHTPPHFHAECSDKKALFDIVDGVFFKGNLPKKEARLVAAWYELHKEELLENWELLNSEGEIKFNKIKPL